ncbi:MAG: hypothetical protein CL842_03335 [Crocinitomicaceae bacterium]|nr:hypothetical protein [Crocinitomicaceae bacterium]|tara:strand:- start:54001 stop:55113 length:1113 start_codon:yes stop_codon:yes gene_type:complete
MKVVHISTVHPTFDGRIFHKECVSLARAGYDVHLIVQHDKDETVNGVQIHHLPAFSGRVNRIIDGNKLAYQKAIELDGDVYHFHDPELMPVGLKLKKRGYKVIFDMHELVGLMIRSKEWIPKPLRWLMEKTYAQFELRAFKNFDKIIVVTEKMVSDYTDIVYSKYKSKVEIVRNYSLVGNIKDTSPKQIDKDGKTVFIYVGGLTRERGILQLVKSIQKFEKGKLWLLGKWESSDFEKECFAADESNRMTYFGLLPMPEVYQYIQASDVGLTVLNPTVNHLASLPVKAFEYMAATKPQIMSNFPFWVRSFDGCAIFIEPDNGKQLEDAFEQMIENPELRESIGNKSFQMVTEQFSWEAESKKLISIYKNFD